MRKTTRTQLNGEMADVMAEMRRFLRDLARGPAPEIPPAAPAPVPVPAGRPDETPVTRACRPLVTSARSG